MTGNQREFAQRMAALRGEGLSQNEAADLAGISRTLWRNMEDPEYSYRTRRPNIVKAARLLAWDLEEALRLAGYTEPPTDLELAAMHRGPRDDLDQLLRELNEEQVRRLVAFLKSMLNPNVFSQPGDEDASEGQDPVRTPHVQDVRRDSGDYLGTRMREERKRERRTDGAGA